MNGAGHNVCVVTNDQKPQPDNRSTVEIAVQLIHTRYMARTATSKSRATEGQVVADPSEWLPCPLVDWTQLAASVAPGKPPTRSRLRTLRANKHISDGVKVTHRDATGVSGAASYYSVLSVWAERARSLGFEDDAETLTSAASALEQEYERPLKDYLSRHTFQDLPDVDFFWTLADKTISVLMKSRTWHDVVVAVASVTDIDDHFAHLEGSSMEGTPRSVDLPRHLAESSRLTRGSWVFVLSRALGAGAYVEIDQAVPSRQMWLAGLRSGCFDTQGEDATGTDDSYDEQALRDYNTVGPGAPLTRELASFAWNSIRESGLKPTPLRPAG